MKVLIALVTIIALILGMTLFISVGLSQEQPTTCNWQVYFSPHGGCTDAVIRELNNAKSTVLVQAYSFTSAHVAKALLNLG